MKFLQKLGKALMLPVAVLPICGILMGIGYRLCPEYDYMTIANTIDEIDRKIVTIKHTLNLTNATAKVQVGNQEMSIDSILIRMAQLNKRKAVLDDMRKRLPI